MDTNGMSRRHVLKLAGGLALIPVFPGCGGGSGGSSTPTDTSTVKAQSAAPFSTLNVSVPQVQTGDTYQAAWSTLKREITPAVAGTTTLAVPVPPLVTSDSAWNAGNANLTITRSRGGVTSTVSTQAVSISALPHSPYVTGTMLRETAALNVRLTQGSASTVLPITGVRYQDRMLYLYESGLGTVPATADQLDILEAMLHSTFLAAGLTFPNAKQKAAVSNAAVVHAASLADFSSADIDLKSIADGLASKVRDSADTLIKFGGAAIIAGEVLAASPVVVAAGATAIGVGLLFGTAESLMLQNASVFGSLDGNVRTEWKDTVDFFVSNVSSNFFGEAIAKYTGLSASNASTRLQAFVADVANAAIADKLGTAFAKATDSVISFVTDDYSVQDVSMAWTQPDPALGDPIISTGAIEASSDGLGIQAADTASSPTADSSGGGTGTEIDCNGDLIPVVNRSAFAEGAGGSAPNRGCR